MADEQKYYYRMHQGAEGDAYGYVKLTKEQAEAIDYVSHRSNWMYLRDDDYCGGFSIDLDHPVTEYAVDIFERECDQESEEDYILDLFGMERPDNEDDQDDYWSEGRYFGHDDDPLADWLDDQYGEYTLELKDNTVFVCGKDCDDKHLEFPVVYRGHVLDPNEVHKLLYHDHIDIADIPEDMRAAGYDLTRADVAGREKPAILNVDVFDIMNEYAKTKETEQTAYSIETNSKGVEYVYGKADIGKGLQDVYFKTSYGGHTWDDAEIKSLLKGDEVSITGRSGNAMSLKLAETSVRGHAYVGPVPTNGSGFGKRAVPEITVAGSDSMARDMESNPSI